MSEPERGRTAPKLHPRPLHVLRVKSEWYWWCERCEGVTQHVANRGYADSAAAANDRAVDHARQFCPGVKASVNRLIADIRALPQVPSRG